MMEEPPVAVWLDCVKPRRYACASPPNTYGYAIGEVASSLPVGGNLLETLDLTLSEHPALSRESRDDKNACIIQVRR
jgi:hypothetical protein